MSTPRPPGFPSSSATPPSPPPPGYQPFHPVGAGYTPANPATQFGSLAGFGERLGAWVVDVVLYGFVAGAAAIPGIVISVRSFEDCRRFANGSTGSRIGCEGDADVQTLLLGLALIILGIAAAAALYLWALARSGRTWGRAAVGIKVINEHTGDAPGWGKAVGRSAFAWLFSAQILYVGYLWMLWDDKHQTLHDKVAGTHVIRT